jgi:hypothetical protein
MIIHTEYMPTIIQRTRLSRLYATRMDSESMATMNTELPTIFGGTRALWDYMQYVIRSTKGGCLVSVLGAESATVDRRRAAAICRSLTACMVVFV